MNEYFSSDYTFSIFCSFWERKKKKNMARPGFEPTINQSMTLNTVRQYHTDFSVHTLKPLQLLLHWSLYMQNFKSNALPINDFKYSEAIPYRLLSTYSEAATTASTQVIVYAKLQNFKSNSPPINDFKSRTRDTQREFFFKE